MVLLKHRWLSSLKSQQGQPLRTFKISLEHEFGRRVDVLRRVDPKCEDNVRVVVESSYKSTKKDTT